MTNQVASVLRKKKERKKVWLLEKAALASFHLSFTALMSKSLPLIKVKAGHFSVLRNKATQTKWKQASSEWAQSSVKRLQCSEFSATSRQLSFTLNGVEWTRTHITTVIFKHLSHSSLRPIGLSQPNRPPQCPSATSFPLPPPVTVNVSMTQPERWEWDIKQRRLVVAVQKRKVKTGELKFKKHRLQMGRASRLCFVLFFFQGD